MLLKSISTAVGLITNRAKIFTNHRLGLDMPECVCLLDVTIIALATKPNQFSHLPTNRAHLR